jgi:hypothetical protein
MLKRARIKNDISLEPHTVLRAGEKGTVVFAEEDAKGLAALEIRMDKFHPGLEEWGNAAYLVEPELSAVALNQPLFYGLDRRLLATLALSGLATVGLIEVALAIEHLLL